MRPGCSIERRTVMIAMMPSLLLMIGIMVMERRGVAHWVKEEEAAEEGKGDGEEGVVEGEAKEEVITGRNHLVRPKIGRKVIDFDV